MTPVPVGTLVARIEVIEIEAFEVFLVEVATLGGVLAVVPQFRKDRESSSSFENSYSPPGPT